jgi:hypothetical protein
LFLDNSRCPVSVAIRTGPAPTWILCLGFCHSPASLPPGPWTGIARRAPAQNAGTRRATDAASKIPSRALIAPVPVCSWSESNCLSRSAFAARLRTSRHKVAVPQNARACVLAVARKPTRSQTRTRKPWVPPEDAARSVRNFVSWGHPPCAGGRLPPPIQATEPTPTATPWALPTPAWGLSAPRPPSGFQILR